MSLFTEDRLRNRVNEEISKSFPRPQSQQTFSKAIINESLQEQKSFSNVAKVYDIFLSHSSGDAGLVAGLKLVLEDLGYSVYVDWIEDPQLSRSSVTKETALVLQARMKQCKSLIYAFSENSTTSKWMPWELGYFDGIKQTAAVLPISKTVKSTFSGSEYLGIYYYIQIDPMQNTTKKALWVHETSSKYVLFNLWLSGSKPIQR